MARTVVLDLAGKHELARDLVAGGVFVPGCDVGINEECELIVRGAEDVRVAALVVFRNDAGAGLQLLGCDAELKQKIAALANPAPPLQPEAEPEPEPEAEPEAEPDTEEARGIAKNLHERMRGLTMVQQMKIARDGELSERILLERIYGKTVWEPLLRNPRVTGPEVARIARMGALPRPMIELIVANGAWLQIPEVRRALLANPRLGVDHIQRILRLMPKHELKLAPMQTAYSLAVRDAARRMLKESGG
jgi:hypothetical protein